MCLCVCVGQICLCVCLRVWIYNLQIPWKCWENNYGKFLFFLFFMYDIVFFFKTFFFQILSLLFYYLTFFPTRKGKKWFKRSKRWKKLNINRWYHFFCHLEKILLHHILNTVLKIILLLGKFWRVSGKFLLKFFVSFISCKCSQAPKVTCLKIFWYFTTHLANGCTK